MRAKGPKRSKYLVQAGEQLALAGLGGLQGALRVEQPPQRALELRQAQLLHGGAPSPVLLFWRELPRGAPGLSRLRGSLLQGWE